MARAEGGPPPPIVGDIEVDHRAKDKILKTFKKAIRIKPDKVQCQEM